MTVRLVWLETASDDLKALYDWIARASDLETALSYTTKVEALADSLVETPRGGSPRDEIAPGLRSIVYRRRTILFYRVGLDDCVEIVRVAHGGRNLHSVFPDND